eukprot:5478892-Prymnesium_polylepis.2
MPSTALIAMAAAGMLPRPWKGRQRLSVEGWCASHRSVHRLADPPARCTAACSAARPARDLTQLPRAAVLRSVTRRVEAERTPAGSRVRRAVAHISRISRSHSGRRSNRRPSSPTPSRSPAAAATTLDLAHTALLPGEWRGALRPPALQRTRRLCGQLRAQEGRRPHQRRAN